MELEKAIDKLKKIITEKSESGYEIALYDFGKDGSKTVLQALDNSIFKNKIKDKTEEQIKEADEILEKEEYIDNFNGSKENQKYYFEGYKDASIFIQELLEG